MRWPTNEQRDAPPLPQLVPRRRHVETISVSLPPDIVRRLRQFGKTGDATISSVVHIALEMYLGKREPRVATAR